MKKFRGWKWLGIMAIMAIIAYQLKKASDRNYPNSYEIKDFGLFEQPDNISCGPSSVKMVLKHYGYVHSLDEVRKIARTDWYVKDDLEIGGTTPEFIERAMEYFGIKAILTTGNLEDIKWYVSQNRPPIALVRSGKSTWHYVVIIGYTEDSIITADPGYGERRVLSYERFENAWNFTSDLHGRDVSTPCWLCGGDGSYWEILGQLGICDLCGGSGKLPDWHWLLMEFGEARGHMIIVPKRPFDESSLQN